MRFLKTDEVRWYAGNAPVSFISAYRNGMVDRPFARQLLSMLQEGGVKPSLDTRNNVSLAAKLGWENIRNDPFSFLFSKGGLEHWWSAIVPGFCIVAPSFLITFDELPVAQKGTTGLVTGYISSMGVQSDGTLPRRDAFMVEAILAPSTAVVTYFECDRKSLNGSLRDRLLQPIQSALSVYFAQESM